MVAYALQGCMLEFVTRPPTPQTDRMAPESKPFNTRLSPTSSGTYRNNSESKKTQLPDGAGVEIGVSTAAVDRSLLVSATTAQAGAVLSSPEPGGESASDAEVMLRVKAGDEAA